LYSLPATKDTFINLEYFHKPLTDTKPKKIYPKKSLGQNYLIDENISKNIVGLFNVSRSDNVLEIGPGKGALTKYLTDKTNNLTVVEIDDNNCKILKENFPSLNVINEDFLKTKLSGDKSNRIIGNIPYNITSEIIFMLIDNRKFIKDALLMLQEEVAQRLASNPNSKEYGIPSVFVQAFSKPGLLFKVSKNCFYPKPKVDSRIIYLDFRQSMENKINNEVFFRKLVRAAFGNRRKTLHNSLKSINIETNNLKIDFDFGRRAETLSVEEFIFLSNNIDS
jgi:16S rRNA (adenine1518-N6/adenine1519-N6)-dimethyltransferase